MPANNDMNDAFRYIDKRSSSKPLPPEPEQQDSMHGNYVDASADEFWAPFIGMELKKVEEIDRLGDTWRVRLTFGGAMRVVLQAWGNDTDEALIISGEQYT